MSDDPTLPAYTGKHLTFLISIESDGKKRRRRRAALVLVAAASIGIAATLWAAAH